MAYETPKHLGRFKAHAPFFASESLDSRRGWSLDDFTELVRDDKPTLPDSPTIESRGYALSADDQTDDYSGDGASDVVD